MKHSKDGSTKEQTLKETKGRKIYNKKIIRKSPKTLNIQYNVHIQQQKVICTAISTQLK